MNSILLEPHTPQSAASSGEQEGTRTRTGKFPTRRRAETPSTTYRDAGRPRTDLALDAGFLYKRRRRPCR